MNFLPLFFNKKLLILLLIVAFFLNDFVTKKITTIEEQHSEIFSIEVKPYDVVYDCYQNYDPRVRYECDSTALYTEDDREVLNKQQSLLGTLPSILLITNIIMIMSVILFIISAYDGLRKHFENREKQKKRKKDLERQQAQKEMDIRRKAEDDKYIEMIRGHIQTREAKGDHLLFVDVLKIRSELNNNNRNEVELMINEHMRKYNPKWK